MQVTNGDSIGNFSSTFTNIDANVIIPSMGGSTTNRVDSIGATNSSARHYSVRLVPRRKTSFQLVRSLEGEDSLEAWPDEEKPGLGA